MSFAERLAAIRARIAQACEAAGREPASVELLPVSKLQPASALQEAMALGLTTFGENYVQEAADKAQAVPNAELVLIGPLQRNKARQALQTFSSLQSVDRLPLAERLLRIAEEEHLVRPVWVQVDLWDETTKEGGCPASELPALLAFLRGAPRLPLKGFMAIPPPNLPEAFLALAELRTQWEDRLGQRLRLSMGMSSDMEAAIRAGSDQVRIGTALFGARH
jgi:pyridoxal phosphate enzyme (YggS family)